MVSARCSCQNVLVVIQTDDTEGTKMISGNDCYDKTSWLCCIFCTFGFYIYDRMLFCFFYTDVLSQALSEDAA